MKKLFIAVLILISASVFAQEVEISTNCVQATDLFGLGEPNLTVQCGFQPGDVKILPANVVATSYKRAGLTPPALPQNFTIRRAGYMVDSETILQEISDAYASAYPNKRVVIESFRMNKDIYIAPESTHELEFDLERFGTNHGVLRADDVRYSFSFIAKIYEKAYITSDRVNPGDDLSKLVSIEEVDVTNLRGTLVKDLKGLTVSRAVSKGRTLTTDMTEGLPERKKGDQVLLVYNDGTIKLEISAIAEGDAVVGKSFPVKNPISGKVFSAVYKGNGIAYTN
ncbi:MAG: flagellar basal body P-ring formation chaperone FlgA [Deferribacteraceae bacterium]|jgi:flagella basal body P-ring formation protein FlgA|nr:flagellar basal body P-ring formation chaperone FlgA [Deferribacteraceae bacterium]